MRQRFAAPFLEPVSEQAAPGYHAIIKQPRDLTSILQRLENNAYTSLGHLRPSFKSRSKEPCLPLGVHIGL